MELRKISGTTLEVSNVCVGTMGFGNPITEPEATRIVHWAVDHGINFFDTADIYEGYDRFPGSPGGVAEEVLGRAVRGRREKVVITTKVGNSTGSDGYSGSGLGRKHVLHQIDLSLQRMGTDYVDIYELHRPDPETPLTETIGVLNDLASAGKVRHWGFSNFSADLVREMIAVCNANHWPRPVVSQPPYSWLSREVEAEHLPACVENGVSVTPFRPLESGLLSGKYRRGLPPPAGSRADDQRDWSVVFDNDLYDRLEAYEREARDTGLSPAAYAVRWVLDRPGVASVVLGVRSVKQMKELLAA